nr:MAG TPA: thioredoxin [Caudoviricetes sp.]
MERLTYWCDNGHGGGKWFVAIDAEGREDYGPHVDRLAAYEETGLEPGDFKRAFSEDTILKLAGQALGITPERLRELAQADKDGKIKAYIVDSFYCDICQKRHDRIKEIKVYLTRDAAEAALSERR